MDPWVIKLGAKPLQLCLVNPTVNTLPPLLKESSLEKPLPECVTAAFPNGSLSKPKGKRTAAAFGKWP